MSAYSQDLVITGAVKLAKRMMANDKILLDSQLAKESAEKVIEFVLENEEHAAEVFAMPELRVIEGGKS